MSLIDRIHCGAAAVALLLTLPALVPAQTGVLVVAHGADSAWNTRVRESVSQVRVDGPVQLAFLMGTEADTSSWDAGVRRLVSAGAKRIVVVPLMVSTFGEHVTQIRYYAGEIKEAPAWLAAMGHDHHATPGASPVPMRVTSALDAAPELGSILAARWYALPAINQRRPLVLVAHGPSAEADVPRWIEGLRAATAPLATALGAQPLHIGLLRDDAGPVVRGAAVAALRDTVSAYARRASDSVVVMTVLISSGQINQLTVPKDLAGLPTAYYGFGLAPDPHLARWIERISGEVEQ